MNRIALLIALIFSAFMCCKKEHEIDTLATQEIATYVPTPQTPIFESLQVSRARLFDKMTEARSIIRERNASPAIVTPSNPTRDVLTSARRGSPPE